MNKNKISKSAKIYPNCLIENSTIADGVIIYPFCVIKNSTIKKDSVVYASHIFESIVGEHATIGPNAHIRSNSIIGDGCRIGNFVEIKNSTIGSDTKAAHLTYIGDADVGSGCNIGCGVVFCNYDGKNKHKTTIGNNVFIGSNCNLIAPIKIEDNTFIAAGSTVTKDIPSNSFVIARAREYIKKRP